MNDILNIFLTRGIEIVKVEKAKLIDVLQNKIGLIKSELPSTLPKEIETIMATKYNVKYAHVVDVFNGVQQLEMQSDDMLFKLTKSMHDALIKRYESFDVSDLDVNIYFTPNNIKQFDKKYTYAKDDRVVKFKEWIQIYPDQYSTKADSDEIYRWQCINRLNYNPKTQRDLIIKNVNGVTIQKIDYNETSGDEIFNLMYNNDYISDEITININTDLYPLPEIKNGEIILSEECVMDLIDGFHRFYSIGRVKSLKPDWKYVCKINLVMWDTDKANQYMWQTNHQNHFSDEKEEELDKSSEAYHAMYKLDTSSKFLLKGEMNENNENYVFVKKQLIKIFDINNSSIKIKDKKEVKKNTFNIVRLIEENINKIIEEKDLYDKKFNKTDWLIYLYLINASNKFNLDIIELVDRAEQNSLFEIIKIQNNPNDKHYSLLNDIIKEVKDYVS